MDRISDSDSEDAGSIPAGATIDFRGRGKPGAVQVGDCFGLFALLPNSQ